MLSLVFAAAFSSVIRGAPTPRPCPITPTTPAAAPPAPGRLHKLADLPDANEVLLVMRSVDGCAYQQVVRFKVSTGGLQRPLAPGGVLVPDGASVMPAAPASR